MTVVPYVAGAHGGERHDVLARLRHFAAHEAGWDVARTSFSDSDPAMPVERRKAFAAACRYAGAGHASGLLTVGRTAVTADDAAYERVLTFLHERRVFLAYLPLLGEGAVQ
ncbi:hypothetical protein [Streptomyces silvensis]|uniref:hypothetical protein n=1 Tax=Streptomyces silvensis TaxID=1765722 RepID=UPI001A7E0E30|nr:hypothetical protein [Streptomyces silvensis]